MKSKVLLVDDSHEIFIMVEQALTGLPIELHEANTIKEAKVLLNKSSYDLIFLDVELPDGNGFELVTYIKSLPYNAAIFFLTAHGELSEKVLGFAIGAEDYITKPFPPLELRARTEAKLRRLENESKRLDVKKWKELEINFHSQEVFVFNKDAQAEKVELTALEFKLLSLFTESPNTVIKRDVILDKIWGENIHVYSRSVDTHVSKLRKKLGNAASTIKSIHGVGYKFEPTV